MKSGLSQLAQSWRHEATAEDFGWRSACALALDYRSAGRRRDTTHAPADAQAQQLVKALREDGYCAIEGMFSEEQCQALRDALDVAVVEHSEFLHSATPYDKRIHGIEALIPAAKLFNEHPLLNAVARGYLQEPARPAFTLGAILEAAPNNPGSGGGWHRDNFTRQFKTMVYLSDVGLEDGPFQLLSKSHHLLTSIRDNRIMHQKYGNSRMTHAQVTGLLEATDPKRLKTLTAKAGTVLLFDSSTIHRGAPIQKGKRYALTNYFYPEAEISQGLYDHFSPVAGHVSSKA